MEFQEGDVVQLKSGSPPMTVSHVHTNDVVCEWFHTGKKEFVSKRLAPHVLKKAKSDEMSTVKVQRG